MNFDDGSRQVSLSQFQTILVMALESGCSECKP
jgi:hypothetical protein